MTRLDLSCPNPNLVNSTLHYIGVHCIKLHCLLWKKSIIMWVSNRLSKNATRLEISKVSYVLRVWAREPMDLWQILSWSSSGLQNLMERAKSVAFEQIVIVSLMKNLLWNVHWCSLQQKFDNQSNVFSLYWIQFCCKEQRKSNRENHFKCR